MAVDEVTNREAAPAAAPPKGPADRPLHACGYFVDRVGPRRPLTSGWLEHTELSSVGRESSQGASGRAQGGTCEEAMRCDMRKPHNTHGSAVGATANGGSTGGRAHNKDERRPCTGGDPTVGPAAVACPRIPTLTGVSCRRLPGGGGPRRRGGRPSGLCPGSVRIAVAAGVRPDLGTYRRRPRGRPWISWRWS
jgi:hypothetical protein